MDLKDNVGRLETASFQTLESKETKEYVATSSNIQKRPRMDSGDTIDFMNAGKYESYFDILWGGGGGGGSNYIFVHGHQIFAKCTMYMYKMYKNVQNMFFPVWKFPG